MFGKSIRIGRLFGINLTVSWSFLVLVAALSLYMAFGSPSFLFGLITGVLSLLLLFASVVAHELGHSLVAQRLGVKIAEIELHFFGGAAKMLSMPRRPRDEIVIAAAGPAVSLVLAGIFGLISLSGIEAYGILLGLAYINLMLGSFNLIPALPTDGGRILRAALSIKRGNLKATQIAVKVARVATIALGIWAVASGNFFAIGVAVFIWWLGSRELRIAEMLHQRGDLAGYGPYQQGFHDPTSGASLVEVYGRDGKLIGTAPGGADTTSTHRPTRPSMLQDIFDALRAEGSASRKHSFVPGPDGRLWVVREGRSSWP